MYVLALDVELRIPGAHSLKDKRQVISSVLHTLPRKFGVSAAEVGHQEQWQRAELGFAVVSSSVGQAERVIDNVEDALWANPSVEVLRADRRWLDD